MHKVNTIDDIKVSIEQIKSLNKGFITNFYFDFAKHTLWIQAGLLFAEDCEECCFLFYQDADIYHLFFMATNVNELKQAFRRLSHNLFPLVIDIVRKADTSMILIWKDLGFSDYMSLFRMTRVGTIEPRAVDPSVSKAKRKDYKIINQLLRNNFDIVSEQLPLPDELIHLIDDGSVLQCQISDNIAGILIYEKTGVTLFLRYWLVLPEFRNMGIGSKLFNAFLQAGIDTKRQILWVVSSNENAIKRYVHYGFNKDGLHDNILIKS